MNVTTYKKCSRLFLTLLFLLLLSNVSGHVLMTHPYSKNNGNFGTPSITAGSYYALASYGIIDKAFFDGDYTLTPWLRPGDFDWRKAKSAVPGHPQLLHPCGCNAATSVHLCAGVSDVASGFGETTYGAVLDTPPTIVPISWAVGTSQETAWNAFANHGGGYIYMMCKKTKFDECRDSNFPNGASKATEKETDKYLKCIWDCFESNTLEWDNDIYDDATLPTRQRLQYLEDECTYATIEPHTKVGKDGHIWRAMPIPDKAYVTNGGDGRCTWDPVRSFSNDDAETNFKISFGDTNVCDTGTDQHSPHKWHIVDRVKVPSDFKPGEYLLSWVYNGGAANQMWSNCADVEIVSNPPQNQDDPNELCPSNSPIPVSIPSPNAAPPNSPVAAPIVVPNEYEAPTACVDNSLPGNWGEDGRTCGLYKEIDIMNQYCSQPVLRDECCFCGGGTTPSYEPPAECTNDPEVNCEKKFKSKKSKKKPGKLCDKTEPKFGGKPYKELCPAQCQKQLCVLGCPDKPKDFKFTIAGKKKKQTCEKVKTKACNKKDKLGFNVYNYCPQKCRKKSKKKAKCLNE